MRRHLIALLATAAVLAMTFGWSSPLAAASPSPTVGSEGIILTCTGWSIPEITFDTDTDGNGNQTATLQILSMDPETGGVVNFEQAYTFPVGTTTSLSGTYTTPLELNAILARLSGVTVQEFVGACDQNRWVAPNMSYGDGPTGGTLPLLFAGCQLTLANLTVTDASAGPVLQIQDQVVPWPYTGAFSPVYATFPVPLPAGYGTAQSFLGQPPDLVWNVSAFCGPAADPVSGTTTFDINLFTAQTAPTTPPAPAPEPVGTSPGFTG